MKLIKRILTIALITNTLAFGQKNQNYDVCIYGGTSGGVMAAVSAARSGKKVLIIEPKAHLGGMSAGGLGCTDIGERWAVTGLARDFYRRMGKVYGRLENFYFEPKEAEKVFNEYAKEPGISVMLRNRIISAVKQGKTLQQIIVEETSGQEKTTIAAKVFIDCSYEGDLMAKAGISYTYGRENNSVYDETLNGFQAGHLHQFPDGISPYQIPGDKQSGLVAGVSVDQPVDAGMGDKKMQAYNFRLCLTQNVQNQIPITKPASYDSTQYELLARVLEKQPGNTINRHLIIHDMPGGKTDINNEGGLSTDYVGGNWDYPEGDYKKRKEIWDRHEVYTKGLLWYFGHSARVPLQIRTEMLKYGYPKDEYTDNGGFSHELYVRESRRMKGAYVMTEANCMAQIMVNDGIAWGAYNMDSHHTQRIIIDGMVKNEGEVTKVLPGPYQVAYRSIVPKAEECSNVLVPVCMSASHIAYGSIRMEPVFMALSQAAGVAASMAIDKNSAVQAIDVPRLQTVLREDPLLNGTHPDLIMDIRHKNAITLKGKWIDTTEFQWSSRTKFWIAEDGGTPKSITFKPEFKYDGRYSINTYLPAFYDQPKESTYPVIIRHANGTDTVKVKTVAKQGHDERMLNLGTYPFKKGKNYSVEFIGTGVKTPVMVCNVMFVPVK